MWSKPKANGTMKVTFHVDSQYKNICWGMLVDESICAADYSSGTAPRARGNISPMRTVWICTVDIAASLDDLGCLVTPKCSTIPEIKIFTLK